MSANRRTIVREVDLTPKTFYNGRSEMQGMYDIVRRFRDNDYDRFERIIRSNFGAAQATSQADVRKMFYMLYPDWRFFDAMEGAYYAFYNDGDDFKGAMENNRIPYNSESDMLRDRFGIPSNNVSYYLRDSSNSNVLESTMQSVVYYYKNDAEINRIREARESDSSIRSCVSCRVPNARFTTMNPSDGNTYCGRECLEKFYGK